MIDSHALVGSCAQVGTNCHISAAAQIGGVLEPVGALPVIIEDDVLVGGNCGVYEGTVVKRRAVLGSGTILKRSTPVYDVVRGEVYRATDDEPLVIPEDAVVVAGSRAITWARARIGAFAVHAGDREVSRLEDRHQDSARRLAEIVERRASGFLPGELGGAVLRGLGRDLCPKRAAAAHRESRDRSLDRRSGQWIARSRAAAEYRSRPLELQRPSLPAPACRSLRR